MLLLLGAASCADEALRPVVPEADAPSVTGRGVVPQGGDDEAPPGDADTSQDTDVMDTDVAVDECAAPSQRCGDACVSPGSDPSNCGGCGIACDDGEVCSLGACVCRRLSCEEIGASCGTQSDGCGGSIDCGNCTTPGATCSAGVCQCTAAQPESDCTNGIDDDCDALADCADPDCDALADCADPDCQSVCGQPACELSDAETRVTSTTYNSVAGVVASTGAGLGVLWLDFTPTAAGDYGLGFARLDLAGSLVPASTVLPLTGGAPSHFPRGLEWDGTGFAVAWSDIRDYTRSNDVFAQLFTATGAARTAEFGVTNEPSLAMPAFIRFNPARGEYVVAWTDSRDDPQVPGSGNIREVYVRRFNTTGAPVGAAVRVTTTLHSPDWPELVWTGSVYGLVWQDYNAGLSAIRFRLLDAELNLVGTEKLIAGESAYGVGLPRVTWNGSSFGLVWGAYGPGYDGSEVFFARLDGTGQLVSTTRVSNAAGASDFPAIVWTGSRYVIAWADARTGMSRIFLRRFDGDGAPLGGEELVSCAPAAAMAPSLAWTGSRVAIGFHDFRSGDADIYVKLIAP